MPNHDRFECQTAIDSDAILHLEFSSLTELKKYRKSHPEKMAFSYSYALSRGVDTQFRHINIAEADHFKQFLRQIERVNSKVFF
ncbi:hypothetical protein OGG48_004276 [Escherichia coli]|nr:hypothetical protein [Escherichia coli]